MAIKLRRRRIRHRLYVEQRIYELHQIIMKEVIEEGTVNHKARELLLKYHSKLNKIL